MPDFTKIAASELDIERKINAQFAVAYLLRLSEGTSDYEIVDELGGNGKLTKYWAPFDFGDGTNLRIKLADRPPYTKAVLDMAEAIGYSRRATGREDRREDFFIYPIIGVRYPEIYSNREYEFRCERTRAIWYPPEFNYAFNFFVLS